MKGGFNDRWILDMLLPIPFRKTDVSILLLDFLVHLATTQSIHTLKTITLSQCNKKDLPVELALLSPSDLIRTLQLPAVTMSTVQL